MPSIDYKQKYEELVKIFPTAQEILKSIKEKNPEHQEPKAKNASKVKGFSK